jgi:DNA-directed RNA polymerase specialized sigma24 family protein
MSPLSLRRYRAERLLRGEFEALRGRVLQNVTIRLRASGVSVGVADLDACYSLAWHGLYGLVLDGEEISNPGGWLTLATFRRAIEEYRVRGRARPAGSEPGASSEEGEGLRGAESGSESDLAAELDDRVRLRHLFEGLRGRLTERELQAATLCYLHGLSRAQAASSMGISEARMRKLMDGDGARRPGVAAKMGALVDTISTGGWCAEQGSLMRGLAYGMLAPGGERHRLAELHRSECPACRAYVLSLRGLAATLPPLPSLLHALGIGTAAGAGAGTAVGAGSPAPPVPALAGGAAAGGAAGGGWALAGGSVGAKLAMGCLLALSVGAGCVALTGLEPLRSPGQVHASRSLERSRPAANAPARHTDHARSLGTPVSLALSPLTPSARASREFGLESGSPAGGQVAAESGGRTATGSAASVEFEPRPTATRAAARPKGSRELSSARAASRSPASSVQAEREFGIG